jgi:lipoprotein NlpD
MTGGAARLVVTIGAFAATVLGACGHHLYHRVERGDTLYAIGWRYGEDYRDLAAWNGLAAPYLLREGDIVRLVPPNFAKAPAAAPDTQTVQKPAASATPRAARAKPAARPATVSGWQWPAQGEIRELRDRNNGQRRAIEIAGAPGQTVRVAAAGRVVYSGNSLKGYGNLVIVKHDDQYLSAYAHNQRNLVKEGEEVATGQRVAEMGRNNNNRIALYFEIRRDGKPVDPLQYLPSRH